MEMVKNIVFDLGGVLLDLDRERCVRSFAEIGYPEAGELLDPYKQSGIFLSLEEGQTSPQELYDYIISKSTKPVTPEMIDRALCDFLVDMPQYKLDMLLDLRKYYKVYMLSNTNAIMFDYIVGQWFSHDGHTINDYFDRLFLSYKMGVAKPSPEIFHKMISEAGFEAHETLFIDDGPANIETASQLGFHTYLAKAEEDYRHIFK